MGDSLTHGLSRLSLRRKVRESLALGREQVWSLYRLPMLVDLSY